MPYPPSQFYYERRAAYSAVTAFQPPFDPILSVTRNAFIVSSSLAFEVRIFLFRWKLILFPSLVIKRKSRYLSIYVETNVVPGSVDCPSSRRMNIWTSRPGSNKPLPRPWRTPGGKRTFLGYRQAEDITLAINLQWPMNRRTKRAQCKELEWGDLVTL